MVITTPNFTHAQVLADALATDKHVLVEKPLCTTVDDCLDVVTAAEGRDAITWMGLQYRFMPTPAAMLDQIATGVCGTMRMVSIREHRFPFLERSATGTASPATPAARSWRSAVTSSI